MGRWLRNFLAAGAAALTLACATGCGAQLGFTLNPQDLYGLPKLPAKYTELNNRLNTILESGAEYAAPVSGSNSAGAADRLRRRRQGGGCGLLPEHCG